MIFLVTTHHPRLAVLNRGNPVFLLNTYQEKQDQSLLNTYNLLASSCSSCFQTFELLRPWRPHFIEKAGQGMTVCDIKDLCCEMLNLHRYTCPLAIKWKVMGRSLPCTKSSHPISSQAFATITMLVDISASSFIWTPPCKRIYFCNK